MPEHNPKTVLMADDDAEDCMLATSEEPKDVALTMKAGAESFITKPATFDGWVQIMKSLAKSWLIG